MRSQKDAVKQESSLNNMIRKETKNVDQSYLEIVNKIITDGVLEENRTGIPAFTIPSAIFEYDMQNGFPILTTKRVSFRLIATELEFFIKGITDKAWLQERNNHIWDEWATPAKVKYGHSSEDKKRMLNEKDLGPIYGFQWRHFNAKYYSQNEDYTDKGVDQLARLVDKLKSDPTDRRMLVSAWNPEQIWAMALPPCHYGFQVTVIDKKLNLSWNQRSVDSMVGLPLNIASYALLLHLLAKESGLKEGKLTGFLTAVHIYKNHMDGVMEQLRRDVKLYKPPEIKTKEFDGIFKWTAADTILENYQSHPKINFEIAV